jgi:hypothetical protein
MRQPNFKLDWFIPNQVVGLTHFHSDVTSDDVMGVIQKGQALTESVENEFHILIDNRVVNSPGLISLDQMKQMVPYMNHPSLRWVVVVRPESLALDTSDLSIEKDGQLRLKNVSSLPEAIDFLREMAPEVQWQQADATFFPNAEIDA